MSVERYEASQEGETVVLKWVLGAAAVAVMTKGYVRTRYDAEFEDVARRRGVPSDLLRAIALQESGMNPLAINTKNDPGEGNDLGLMGINERTARALGRDLERLKRDAAYSIDTAADLLVRIRRELGTVYTLSTWIAAYNAGAPAIRKRGIFNGAYVASVSWHFQLFQLAGLFRRIA